MYVSSIFIVICSITTTIIITIRARGLEKQDLEIIDR